MKSMAKKVAKFFAVLISVAFGLFAYNYLRFAVFWVPHEKVAFESEPGNVIRGTLLKPAEGGTFPAVVILHGSGPETRDEISYRIMANVLVRSGLAVLLYDKRGSGESDGEFASARFVDFVADATAAVAYLAARADIDGDRVGLLGNSESGWLTPEIAWRTGQVDFILNRAGPPLSWRDNVIWEVRNDLLADGVEHSQLQPLLAHTRRRWDYYIAAASDPALATGPERAGISDELQRLRADVPAARRRLPEELAPYDAEAYAADAEIYGYDPRTFLEKIDVPMLYVFAENDINVPTEKSVAFLEALRSDYDRNIEFVVLEGVGHAMAGWRGLLTAGYVPEFIGLLEKWPAGQVVN